MAKVTSLLAFRSQSRDWTNQELAEFYRVENALIQVGMKISVDRGLSDEGDPWFIFFREADGEPVVHFARIDGQYVMVSPAFESVTRGSDFKTLVQNLIDRHCLKSRGDQAGKSNVFMHPAALLIVVVGTAFFKASSQAQAKEIRSGSDQKSVSVSVDAGPNSVGQTVSAPAASENVSSYQVNQIVVAAYLAQLAYAAERDDTRVPGVDVQDLVASRANDDYFVSSALNEPNAAQDQLLKVGDVTSVNPIFNAMSDLVSQLIGPSQAIVDTPSKDILVHFGIEDASHVAVASFTGAQLGTLEFSTDTYEFGTLSKALPNSGTFDYTHYLEAYNSAVGKSAGINISTNAISTPTAVATSPTTPATHAKSSVAHEGAFSIAKLPIDLESVGYKLDVSTKDGTAIDFLSKYNLASIGSTESAGQTAPNQNLSSTTTKTLAVSSLAEPASKSTVTVPENQPSAPTNDGNTLENAKLGEVYVSATGVAQGELISVDVFAKALEAFVSDHKNDMKVALVEGSKYVFYGSDLVSSPASSLEKVTLSFSDGSSIAIVGQHQQLDHIITGLH